MGEFSRDMTTVISTEEMKLAQVKKIVKEENTGVPPKKLKRKVNGLNKNLKKISFKDVFRRLTGAIFSKISQEGRFAQLNLNEGVKRHGEKSIEVLLI